MKHRYMAPEQHSEEQDIAPKHIVRTSQKSLPEFDDTIVSEGNEGSVYKQELRRGISPFGSFAMCFTNAAIIPSLFLQMQFGFKTGGPVVMLYGWLFVGVLTMVTGAVMAEICSVYPVAGSVYYWAGALAKP